MLVALVLLSQESGRLLTLVEGETSWQAVQMEGIGSPLCIPLQRWNHQHSGAAVAVQLPLIEPSIWLLQRLESLGWTSARYERGP